MRRCASKVNIVVGQLDNRVNNALLDELLAFRMIQRVL